MYRVCTRFSSCVFLVFSLTASSCALLCSIFKRCNVCFRSSMSRGFTRIRFEGAEPERTSCCGGDCCREGERLGFCCSGGFFCVCENHFFDWVFGKWVAVLAKAPCFGKWNKSSGCYYCVWVKVWGSGECDGELELRGRAAGCI